MPKVVYIKRLPRKKRFLTLKIVFLLFVFFASFIFFKNQTQKPPQKPQPPQQFFLNSQNKQKPSPSTIANLQIESIFKSEIPALDGHWAIVVKNLKTQKVYQYNQQDVFPAASLYKLAVMWSTFQALKNGELEENQTVGDYSMDDALNLMITVSHNEAATALAEQLGWANIEKQMKKEGFTSFDLTGENSPKVNAFDVEKLLERIYTNTAVSTQASGQMKDLLFAQTINDRIPALLPPDVKVGHKTGEIDNLRHDAGIVMGKKGNYIFVFLTDTPVPEDAKDTIANLSKEIYNALEH